MAQQNITNFFVTDSRSRQISDLDESESVENFILPSADVGYYEKLFKDREDLKKLAKVKISEVGFSECWKYFGNLYIKNKIILDKFKFCNICLEQNGSLKSFSKSTSTTNYINHLRIAHSVEVIPLTQRKTSIITQSALGPSSTNNNKFQNGRRVAEMCCWDLQPFKIVEKPGFQNIHQFPESKNFSSVLQTELWQPVLSTTSIMSIATTSKQFYKNLHKTSRWSQICGRIILKIHYCQDFVMKAVTLKTEFFPRPHTASSVSEKISEALREFALEKKNICAVTDGGTNIVAALKQTNIMRFGCIAHILHRFISHDLLENERFEHINTILFKLKQIYRTLMYSSEEIRRLQNLEEQGTIRKIILETESFLESFENNEKYTNGDDNFQQSFLDIRSVKQGSLKNSVPTRWNSLLKMIESFTKNINIINIALIKSKKDPLVIPEMEKQIVKEFGNFLKIFEDATQYLQGQSYPTISTSIFFYENIMEALEKLEHYSSFQLTIDLCSYSKENFRNRFKILKIHVIAALMDPSQKNWEVLDKYVNKIPVNANNAFVLGQDIANSNKKEILILEEITKVVNCELNVHSTNENISGHEDKKQKLSIGRQKMLEALQTLPSEKNSLREEVKSYFNTDVSETESLDWWQQHSNIFPNVAKLANICFGIPATSASSEQAFSVAGNCVNAHRSSLHYETVKQQLFVHDNRIIVEPLLS